MSRAAERELLATAAALGHVLRTEAAAARHRRAVCLRGPAESTRPLVRALLGEGDPADVIWLGAGGPGWAAPGIPIERARSVLGRQARAVVVDLGGRCPADALGAASGVVAGGGMLVLLVPAHWGRRGPADRAALVVEPHPPEAVGDRFPARLARVLNDAPGVALLDTTTGGVHGGVDPRDIDPPATGAFDDRWCLTADQRRAVDAVLKVATGRRRRPVVLTADRGRGKSAALGIAAGLLTRDGRRGIVVIGPNRAAVAPVFEHAARVADTPPDLRFVAPAELAAGLPEATLLLVDEAATLPVSLLRRVLEGHPRVVFSTTVHGYEGTGRGFAVRFTGLLDHRTPGWRAVRMVEPVRWAADDPVEEAVFDALLLDAAPHPPPTPPGPLQIERWDRDALASDETSLRALFGLLVTAHYRTSPADLEQLLDAPDLSVWTARDRGCIVGTALVAAEGGLSPTLARAIHAGERRPAGHFLPETLAAHLGLVAAPEARFVRVVRIAVHGDARRRGIGRALLDAIERQARADGVDAMGSAFGMTDDLLGFWADSGYRPVRVGLTRGRSSGLHSAVVLRPLTERGQTVFDAARHRCARHLPHALGEPLAGLDPALAVRLLRAWPAPDDPPSPHDIAELDAFAHGRRVYGVVMDVLWRVAPALIGSDALAPEARRLVVARILQRRPWAECAVIAGESGRSGVNRSLAAAVRDWRRPQGASGGEA